MASWKVETLQVQDVPEFTRCQFKVFEEDPLHHVVYPTIEEAEEAHLKSVRDFSQLPTGWGVHSRKVVDQSGQLIGGMKCYLIDPEIEDDVSPWRTEIPTAERTDFVKDVKAEFMVNRADVIKGRHACESLAS